MFGIDLGINIASVSCITERNEVIDYRIIFGDKDNPDNWNRITRMSDALIDAAGEMIRAFPGMIIENLVSIEEPIYKWGSKNPKSYFTLSCLYALTRNKLSKRGFTIYSIHPLTAKSIAKTSAFKGKILDKEYVDGGGKLTKKGMLKAYKKLLGQEPNYHTIAGRETLADSFFIAKAGLVKRGMELNAS